MNFKKVFASLILSVATLASFACQYAWPGVVVIQPDSNSREWQRCFYLSGVNSPTNHISCVTYTVNGNDVSASYTATNHQTVYLPLTVYVGVFDLCGGTNAVSTRTTTDAGAEYERITMSVQYRVLPDTTWHTAATKRFSAGDIAIMTQKKLFGAAQIDCEATSGSIILIRLYIAAYKYKLIRSNGTILNYAFSTENADRDSPVVSASSDISNSEVSTFSVAADGANLLVPGFHFSKVAEGNTYVTYQDGWTPQFVMAVTVGNKRRPGK